MIIRRYLVKQVVSTSVVVIALLTLIMMGGRLIKYFGVAAQGRLDVSILFSIIGYRLPEFLTLILPLGFFISLMLVFGRLYVDHEMAVFNSSGLSRNHLAKLLVPMTVGFMLIQSFLMFWAGPWGVRKYEELTSTQAIRSGFDLVRPKEFISSGPYTIYAGDLSEDRKKLRDIFVYQRAKAQGKPDVIILAKEAERIDVPGDTASVVDLTEGRRYEIYPGQPKYSHIEFESYRLRLENNKEAKFDSAEVDALPTMQLWENRHDPVIASELWWRVFVPLTLFVALFLAVALSEVSPRQGRYLKLFPALLIFASLIVILMALKTRITKEEVGVWTYPAVLLAYSIFAVLFSRKQKLTAKFKNTTKQVRS